MKSTLSISLVCAAAVIIGAQKFAQTSATGKEFCIEHNAGGNLLAYTNCTLACNKTEPVNNNTPALKDTPCLYSPGENEAMDNSRPAEMYNGTCVNGKCTPTKNESSYSAVTPTTQKANVNSATRSTERQSSPQTATTMPANETSSNAPSNATGTTMTPTASHNGTTMHANATTTEKPPNAASPSRLLGAANQGAIISVLALAVFGRSL